MDIYDKTTRSRIMSNISGKETKPEIIVRKYLFALGFRYKKNVKSLPGKPDIVLPKYKTVIFVNGCFWHGHDCKNGVLPKTNIDFWTEKINSNKNRDLKVTSDLNDAGWRVITIWQCEISNLENRRHRLQLLVDEIKHKVFPS